MTEVVQASDGELDAFLATLNVVEIDGMAKQTLLSKPDAHHPGLMNNVMLPFDKPVSNCDSARVVPSCS
jgi:hypothetical protein